MAYPPSDPRSIWAWAWFEEGERKRRQKKKKRKIKRKVKDKISYNECPRCGEPISPTDEYCPICQLNLRMKPEEIEQIKRGYGILARIYTISLLLGIPILLTLFRKVFEDPIIGFNWVSFLIYATTIGVLLGFICLLVLTIIVRTVQRVLSAWKKHHNK